MTSQGASAEELIEAGLVVKPDADGADGRTRQPYDRFRNRVIFPITDTGGRVIAFGARTLEPDGKPSNELAEHIRFTRQVAEASLFTGTVEPSPDAERRADVRRVQTALAELAYSPGEINGELTSQTRDAIMAFERDRRMPETGQISDALVAELAKMSGQSELATQ